MHHSDRGSQYASHAFQDKLKAYGMTCSMRQTDSLKKPSLFLASNSLILSAPYNGTSLPRLLALCENDGEG